MEPNHIHETIASQIHHMKPAHLVPGKTIGLEVVDDLTVRVVVVPTGVSATVAYDEGRDLYNVVVTKHDGATMEYEGAYCDQLGELIFGVNAEQWTQPMGALITEGPDGQLSIEVF
jgi:hypothetical protein